VQFCCVEPDIRSVMEKRLDLSLKAALLAAFFGLCVLSALAGGQDSDGLVTIKGQMFSGPGVGEQAILVVELEEDQCLRSVLLRNGRFNFDVPVGAKARLIFIQPGYHTKEVTVDTKNALCSERSRQMNDKVKFDVVLEPLEEHPRETYLGPVGSIRFVRGTGLMRVDHNGRLVAIVDDGSDDR
jgi:hypothetical protein